jgi:hypothetical protein
MRSTPHPVWTLGHRSLPFPHVTETSAARWASQEWRTMPDAWIDERDRTIGQMNSEQVRQMLSSMGLYPMTQILQ